MLPGVDGISDFNALHSRRHDEEVQLYAFDRLALDGEDLRGLLLSKSAFAVPRLMSSSNLVGYCTGNFLGFGTLKNFTPRPSSLASS